MSNLKEILLWEFGLQGAEKYARKINNPEYQQVANELKAQINKKFQRRLELLAEVSRLPGYHPVEGDLGTVPI